MARLSRITVPGLPHHVTQRGNRRQPLFAEPGDYALYRDLLAERCRTNGVACWAYCLMPNHVHLVLVPADADALSRAVGEAHRRFTAFVNARARTTGHLFQARFASFAMDDAHFLNALRYLAFNPVRAGLAASPEAWPWSSVRAHLQGRDDALVQVGPALERVPRFADLLEMSQLRGHDTHCKISRPGYDGPMARLSRITVPGLPHHVTQRGNRRQALFAEPGDYALYRDLLAERCRANGVACWAYCLMPNHVHLVLTPLNAGALSRAVGEAHRRFTAFVNARARTTGHLFQARFASFAMDDAHFLNALRYLAFNPVRAGLAASPEGWPWSSVRAHLEGRDDALVAVGPALERVARFADLLDLSPGEQGALDGFETRSPNGRPLGAADFIAGIEAKLGRTVRPGRRGRKPQGAGTG